MSRRVALRVLVLYAAGLAVVTLVASPASALRWTTRALLGSDDSDTTTVMTVEGGANVLLFVPAGLLLCYALPRIARWQVWSLCVLVSAGVELAQTVLPGRQPSVIDLVTNASGAAIGVLLHLVLTRRR